MINKDWFKEIEYTPEVILGLRKTVMESGVGIGYVGDMGLIEFDKAIRVDLKRQYNNE